LHEEEASTRRRELRILDARRAAERHQRVRVLPRDELCLAASAIEAPEDDPTVTTVEQVIEAEGIVLDPSARAGLIGRRADGSLVSKHDANLDARLKAQSLQDNFDSAGDIAEARIPGRVYNELRRKETKLAPARRYT